MAVYTSNKKVLSSLNAIHHTVITLAIGDLPTTTVNRILLETGQLTLDLYFFHSLFFKPKSFFYSPSFQFLLTNFCFYLTNKKYPVLSSNLPPSVLLSSLDIIHPLNNHSISTDISLTKFSNSYTPKQIMKVAYTETISRYPYHSIYFTDGSKNKTEVGGG